MNKIQHHPNRLAERLLKHLLPKRCHHDLMGDYQEIYHEQAEIKGWLSANGWYWVQIILLVANRTTQQLKWRLIMILRTGKMIFRNLRFHVGHSLINLFSLTLSFSVLLFIAQFINHELKHDGHNTHLKNMYTVMMGDQQMLISAAGLELQENIPEIEKMVRFFRRSDYALQYKINESLDRSVMIKDLSFVWTDPEIFDLFTYEFIYGPPQGALDEPSSIVLTQDVAEQLFGQENPVGKVIHLNSRIDLNVTAVVAKPKNSHLSINVFASVLTLRARSGPEADRNYEYNSHPTYVMLPENCDVEAVTQKVNAHMNDVFKRVGREPDIFSLLPVKDLYFSDIRYSGNHGSLTLMWVLATVAAFITLIASINFINLSTARASTRAREIGMKKVVGVSQKTLILQFLGESVFMALLSFLAALILIIITLPAVNHSLATQLSRNALLAPQFLGYMVTLACAIGLASGLYPAFYLSSFRPLKVIKGELTRGKKGAAFRKTMLVLQFAVSITLMIGSVVIFNQIRYIKNKDLGFSGEHVITFAMPRTNNFYQNVETVKAELLKHPHIRQVSISHGYPGRPSNNEALMINDEPIGFTHYSADAAFKEVYRLQLLEGRFIDPDRQGDRLRAVVLNETAVKQFGLTNPVGQRRPIANRGLTAFPVEEIHIVGVVKDFHCRPLHREINPVIISYNEDWLSRGNLLISEGHEGEVVEYVRGLWRRFAPGIPFEYVMVDEDFHQMYAKDEVFERVFFYAVSFSILITCLGLWGLTSYVAEKRAKEIGIRKVLGSSLTNTLSLLFREFSLALFLANFIAWPVAYWAMRGWLQNFAYQTSLNLWMFMASGLTVLLIALFTVSFQGMKAATRNPADVLRNE